MSHLSTIMSQKSKLRDKLANALLRNCDHDSVKGDSRVERQSQPAPQRLALSVR
jgi:hypothetical protein